MMVLIVPSNSKIELNEVHSMHDDINKSIKIFHLGIGNEKIPID